MQNQDLTNQVTTALRALLPSLRDQVSTEDVCAWLRTEDIPCESKDILRILMDLTTRQKLYTKIDCTHVGSRAISMLVFKRTSHRL